MFVFVLFETNTENEVYVRKRHFHWWARDRKVARKPESRCRALLPCPMAHARRYARAVSRACAIAAQTAKLFRALPAGDEERVSLKPLLDDLPSSVFDSSKWSEMLATFGDDDRNFI